MPAPKTVELEFDDPTIFAVCSGACNRHYPGKSVGNYFGKAYTERKWKRGPICDNCGSPMTRIYEIERG
jgi:hypothetical protein